MKYLRSLITSSILVVIIGLFLIPSLAAAADTNPLVSSGPSAVNGLVPCGNEPDANNAATSCDFNQFIILIRNVMNFAIILAIPISTVTFAIVGFMIMTAQGNPNKIIRAKQIAWRLLIGFLIMLSAWILVHVIASALLKPEFNFLMQSTP